MENGVLDVSLHNAYLIALSALFALVFAIMIHSLLRHRHAGAGSPARFSGPTGTVQCLWAMVPIAILLSVDVALIEAPDHRPPAKTIALASVTAKPDWPANSVNSGPARHQRPGDPSLATTGRRAIQ